MPELQEPADPVHQQRAAPGVAEGQGVRPQQQHRPHHLAREGRPHARRVRHQQVLLELDGVVGRDGGRREVAEACRHPVDDVSAGNQRLDDVPSLLHPVACVDVESGRDPVPGHRLHVADIEVGAGQDDAVRAPRSG